MCLNINKKFANLIKTQIETLILPFVPKNKRGFPPKVDLAERVRRNNEEQERLQKEVESLKGFR